MSIQLKEIQMMPLEENLILFLIVKLKDMVYRVIKIPFTPTLTVYTMKEPIHIDIIENAVVVTGIIQVRMQQPTRRDMKKSILTDAMTHAKSAIKIFSMGKRQQFQVALNVIVRLSQV